MSGVPGLLAALPGQPWTCPLLPHGNSELFFVLAEFCKGVCDQRSEGAGGRLHQERAEEGWRSQLRCSDRVAPAPHPRAICLLHPGGDCHLQSPAHQGGGAMRGAGATSVCNPLPCPPCPSLPSVALSSSLSIIIWYLPPFCSLKKSHLGARVMHTIKSQVPPSVALGLAFPLPSLWPA